MLFRSYSPNPDHRRDFAQRVGEEAKVEIRPVDSPQECIKGVDIVAVATDSREPVLKAEWLEPGMHITGVGNEMDKAGRDRVDIYSHRDRQIQGWENWWSDASLKRMDEIWPGHERVYGAVTRDNVDKFPTIGEIITGKASGRDNDEQITYFFSGIGLGIEFAAVGAHVVAMAREKKLGLEVPDDWFSQTEHT